MTFIFARVDDDMAFALNNGTYTATEPGPDERGYVASIKIVVKGGSIAKVEYDGFHRRTVRKDYVSGSLDETRHFYYSHKWQA